MQGKDWPRGNEPRKVKRRWVGRRLIDRGYAFARPKIAGRTVHTSVNAPEGEARMLMADLRVAAPVTPALEDRGWSRFVSPSREDRARGTAVTSVVCNG